MESKRDVKQEVLIVILIIIAIIFYLFTFGKFSSKGKQPEEFRDDNLQAKIRHQKLTKLLESQKGLKQKLNKKFRLIYFCVRFLLVLFWIGIMSILYIFSIIKDLGDFLNYSELSVIIIITLYFLVFGTVKDLNNFLDLFKTKTENLVYGKYVNINEKIDENQKEVELLATKIGDG